MTKTIDERMTVARDQGFVVFLIGARVNKWWLVPIVWAVARSFSRMMAELAADPDAGLLSSESYAGRTTMTVQYWRSVDDLLRYAKARDKTHLPVWAKWAKRWSASGAVGIYHETYVVEPGGYECLYHHMPPFGLGKVGPLVPARGHRQTARGRLT